MLNKKLFRDIKSNLSQFITIFLMVLIGVLAYSGIEAYMTGMEKSASIFYTENNLQDLNVVGKLDNDDVLKIKRLDNVLDAEGKLSVNTKMVSDNDITLLTNFIETNNISKFYIVEGEKFTNEPGIWIDNFFAKENKLKIGDVIKFKYNGYTFEEKIKGFINVPDHLYDVKDESELYPNHKDFGFVYVSTTELEDYIKEEVIKEKGIDNKKDLEKFIPDFDYKKHIIYNTIMVDAKDKNELNNLKDIIEQNLEGSSTVDIEDTASFRQYQGEIDEGKTYIGVFSGLFIFIAILSVITTMTRVVKKQRTGIGTLKALGFKNSKIMIHYINYGFYIATLGAIVGLFLGYFTIGKLFITMEMSFFELPNGKPVMNSSSYIMAIIVVLIVSFVTYLATRKVLKEKPVETLRQQLPNVKNGSIDITTKGIFKKMSFSTIWNVRDIIRNKIRTITGIVGISGCSMLIVCAFGMFNSMNHFIELQFSTLYNFDYKLSLKENITEEEYDDLITTYGDNTSETILIEIKDKDGNRESNNIFVTDAKDYVRFVDTSENFINIDSNDGVYITRKLASNMNLKIGDKIKWHIYGDNTYYESKIVGFNKDPQNQNITMTKEYLESLNIKYKPDSLYTNEKIDKGQEIIGVELISDINELKSGMQNMLSTMKSMICLIIGVAIILGMIIIYNMGILSFSEKQYQFATLKVLGFKDKQIKQIYIKQNNIIAVIAIILGCPLGFYLTDWLFKTAIEESYDFGAHINISTYVIAIIGTFATSYLVSKLLAKKINKIDMVSSLKGNE